MKPIKNRHPVITDLTTSRRNLGLSQEELSDRMGYARGNLSTYELGRSAPNMRFLTTWAQALGFDITLKPRDDDK